MKINIPADTGITVIQILENLWVRKPCQRCFRHTKNRSSYARPPKPPNYNKCEDVAPILLTSHRPLSQLYQLPSLSDGAPSHTKAPRGSTRAVDEDLEALSAFQ